MSDDKFLHFGYASNMLKERLLVSKPGVYKKFICAAKLKDYKLTFDRTWPLPGEWHGPCATIRPEVGKETWGALWELDFKDKANLLGQEVNLTTLDVNVEDKDGTGYQCLVFMMTGGDHPGEPPSPQYKDIILRGARQTGVPDYYLQFLSSLPDNSYNGPHELYQQVLQTL